MVKNMNKKKKKSEIIFYKTSDKKISVSVSPANAGLIDFFFYCLFMHGHV